MFSSNKKQYVNILKQNKQLHVDYTILQDNKIIKQEQSSFLIVDTNMPQDALFKIDTLQKNIPYTYVTSLLEGDRQHVQLTKDIDLIGYNSVKIDNRYSVVVPKNELVSASRYFVNSGIDYIISPFTILNEYVQNHSVKNSLNVLIYNDIVYAMIFNHLKVLIKAETKVLTLFDQVSDKSFSDDEIVDQKLYEEVHFLEIQQFLNDTVQEYYTQNDDVEFLEQVKILYTVKSLLDEQINSLYETIMVNIDYEAINMGQYLSEITQKDSIAINSFIDPRMKKQPSNKLVWFSLALLSIMAVFGLLYTQFSDKKKSIIEEKVKKQVEQIAKEKAKAKKIVPKIIKFPNHITKNNRLLQEIHMLFDIVPYDAVLKDLEISQNSSTYVAIFIAKSKSFEDMRIKLLNLYKDSKVLLKHQNKSLLNIIIKNENLQNIPKKPQYEQYPTSPFLSIGKTTDYINNLLIDNSTIKFLNKKEGKYLTYKFSIKSVIKTPKEFFDFIAKLNQQKHSLTLEYPITFSKTNDGIEIKYILALHQKNKKQVQPSR